MKRLSAVFWGLLFATGVGAQTIDVQGAWARATVDGQTATGVYMTLLAPEGAALVGAASAAAGVAQIHKMTMEGSVMNMQAIERLALPAGQAVELKPGGYHLMLMDLKQTLKASTTVDVTLHFETADGKHVRLPVSVPVLRIAPSPDKAHHPMHMHAH